MDEDEKEERIDALEQAEELINEAIELINMAVEGTDNEIPAQNYIIGHLRDWIDGYDSTCIRKLIKDIEDYEGEEE